MSKIVARYPLDNYPACFDFYHWLLIVKAMGASEIVFSGLKFIKDYKWSRAEAVRRFYSIIWPGPALAGLPCRMGLDGVPLTGPHLRKLVEFVKSGGNVQPFESVLPPAKVDYTVTLRGTVRVPHRNSDETVWRQFAREIGAHVIEDYRDRPIHLHERMALYAAARMNFGVTNGPMFLCSMTRYPTAICDCSSNLGTFIKCKIGVGVPHLPWKFGEQYLLWERPTVANLMAWFEDWRDSASRRLAA